MATTLTSLGFIWTTPGFTDEKIWLYLAEGLTESKQALEDSEVLAIERYKAGDVFKMVHEGEINDGKSMCALLRAQAHLAQQKEDSEL